MRTKGRPILGGFAGFFFGIGLGLLLLTMSVIPLESKVLIVLPLLFLVVGVAFALWAPLRRGRAQAGQ